MVYLFFRDISEKSDAIIEKGNFRALVENNQGIITIDEEFKV
jgi:hypothetical protein